MVAKVAKAARTTMFSVEPNGDIIEHHFPWDRNDKFQSEKFAQFERRGFTYERPVQKFVSQVTGISGESTSVPPPYQCKQCGQGFDTPLALARHTKEHKA